MPNILDLNRMQESKVGSSQVLNFLMPLSNSYPLFEIWFKSKVLPGLPLRTRHIVTIERHGGVAAVGIGKRENGERKVCTIRVDPAYEGRGLGIRVLDYLLDWLDTDFPLATVSEEKMPLFERIFERYGFMLSSVENGLYRPGRVEFVFNQPFVLPKSAPTTTSIIPVMAEPGVLNSLKYSTRRAYA